MRARRARRDDRGRWQSNGRRLLGALLQARSATQIARDVQCTTAAISALATGVNQYPTLPIAIALHRKFGVDVASWVDDGRFSIPVEAPHGNVESMSKGDKPGIDVTHRELLDKGAKAARDGGGAAAERLFREGAAKEQKAADDRERKRVEEREAARRSEKRDPPALD